MIITDITGIGDPQILLHDNTYYCYATSHPHGFRVWTSQDLVHWSAPQLCMEADESHWGFECFWAPEVVYHNGVFLMHYTARRKTDCSLRIGVAQSSSPLGPFIDVHGAPMFDEGYAAIDGSVLSFNGMHYLYYSRDCSENRIDGIPTSQIYCVQLDESLTRTVGTHHLLTTPEHPWERRSLDINHLWNEGPCVIAWEDRLIMNYSANCYASNAYSICIAEADAPLGPFRKCTEANPVLCAREGLFGAGHNAFFRSKDGMLMTAFHVQSDPEHPSGNRRVCIGTVSLRRENGVILQEIL